MGSETDRGRLPCWRRWVAGGYGRVPAEGGEEGRRTVEDTHQRRPLKTNPIMQTTSLRLLHSSGDLRPALAVSLPSLGNMAASPIHTNSGTTHTTARMSQTFELLIH